jgi:hypothetical protein
MGTNPSCAALDGGCIAAATGAATQHVMTSSNPAISKRRVETSASSVIWDLLRIAFANFVSFDIFVMVFVTAMAF